MEKTMIRILNGKTRAQHPAAVDDMFRLRKRVFHDFLKWDVQTEGDWEIDNYDQANPLYVLSYAPDTGRLRGALRLLPTLGPNMLDDTFPILLGDNPEIRSASVWESSRFCIEPEISQDRASNQVTVAAAELMCGVGELGLRFRHQPHRHGDGCVPGAHVPAHGMPGRAYRRTASHRLRFRGCRRLGSNAGSAHADEGGRCHRRYRARTSDVAGNRPRRLSASVDLRC